jgi:hypothetical protein
MDRDGGGAEHPPARPVLYAVARTRAGGRFTYLTPHWPDARGYLVGLLEHDAGDVAGQVPVDPPADTWSSQVGQCRYQLTRQDLASERQQPSAATPTTKPATAQQEVPAHA